MGKYFFAIILLFFTMNVYSQQQIEGFWNIKLGERESIVISSVKKQYPNAKFDDDIVGKPFRVKKPYLAGIEMDVCEFSFSNNIFVKAEFDKGDAKIIPEYELQSFVSKMEQDLLPYFSQLVNLISSKYGTPIMGGDSALWRSSNGNTIIIKSKTTTNREVFDNGMVWTYYGLTVIYTKGVHVNDF